MTYDDGKVREYFYTPRQEADSFDLGPESPSSLKDAHRSQHLAPRVYKLLSSGYTCGKVIIFKG